MKARMTLALVLWLVWATALAGDDRAFFWTVERDGRVAHVFGSIHVANDSFYPLRQRILRAFADSDVLLVEVDIGNAATALGATWDLIRFGYYPPGQSLADDLTPQTLARFKAYLDTTGIPFEKIDRQRAGVIASVMTVSAMSRAGYNAEDGLDLYFMNRARGAKPIRQIETAAFQMQMLADLPAEPMMRETLDMLEHGADVFPAMETAWKQGNDQMLLEVARMAATPKDADEAQMEQRLLGDRNQGMADAIDDCIARAETCFMVVGALHLVGRENVIDILEQRGYSVRRR